MKILLALARFENTLQLNNYLQHVSASLLFQHDNLNMHDKNVSETVFVCCALVGFEEDCQVHSGAE